MSKIDSRIPGFYKLPLNVRQAELVERAGLDGGATLTLASGGLNASAADRVVDRSLIHM